jgi:hypothetical protein
MANVPTASTEFKPGNKMAVGRHKASRNFNRVLPTQVLISQLNEINPETGSAKMHDLADQLIKRALGFDKKMTIKGKKKIVHVESDISAIREIWDRVEGKAPQSITMNGAMSMEIREITDKMSPQEAAAAFMETLKVVGGTEFLSEKDDE